MKNRTLLASLGLFSLALGVTACTGAATEPRSQVPVGGTTNGSSAATTKTQSDATQTEGSTTKDTSASSDSTSSSAMGAGNSGTPTPTPGSGSSSSSGNYSSSSSGGTSSTSSSSTSAPAATTTTTTTSTTASPSANYSSGDNMGGATDAVVDEASSEGSSAEAIKARIAARQADLQRERDRNGRLRAELMLTRNGGCWSEQRLKKLEVEINGSHLAHGQPTRAGSPLKNEGNAAQMRFVFSETLAITIENEEQQQLFSPAGRYITGDLSQSLIRDISMLKVVKGGIAYLVSQIVLPHNIFSTKTKYDSAETNRYSLGGLTIKINDQIFYKKTNINYTFEGDNREWREGSLGSNADYMRLMSRQDCPAAQ